MEGDWTPDRVVIAKFESFRAARPSTIRPSTAGGPRSREGATIMRLVCVEGV